ncbi:MAG: type II secretion system protein [Proteobacteria bacterium]|nr:type II secretion system protein [Pseudomonadota bacterium]
MRKAPPPASDAGFLMVEALIALAIVALMAGVVFETVWQMGQTAARGGQQREAILLARSIMAAASVDTPAPAIAPSGRDGAMTWTIASNAYGEGGAGRPLRELHVVVRDADAGVVLARLDSLKVGP